MGRVGFFVAAGSRVEPGTGFLDWRAAWFAHHAPGLTRGLDGLGGALWFRGPGSGPGRGATGTARGLPKGRAGLSGVALY